MKKSKLIQLLVAAAMALPLAASAEEGMPPERGPPAHGGPGMPFLRGLDLSESQEDKLFQLTHAQAPYLREQQRAHERAMRALHDMRHAEKFDDAAAARLAQAAAQAQANITLARIRMHQKVLTLLSPEQRKQLEERKGRPQREASMNVNPLAASSYTGPPTATGTQQARQASPPAPPGPPPDAGGFVSAIGAALESLGVSDVAASDKESAASALGSFLQELMASLHEQGEANGEQSGARPEAGGPGRLAQDLESLLSSLQGDTQSGQASALQASFSSLLESLGADSSDPQASLAGFLQALADKLPQGGSSGNLINTTA